MPSTIFQVSKNQMEQDDHLTSYDIAENDYGYFGIDWIGDERDLDDGFDSLENALPKELFESNRTDRSITVRRKNIKMILRRMVNTIRDKANELNEDNILNWRETYMVKSACMNYMGHNALFYYENELMPLNQFIKDIASDDNVTTLYIGAMLDYHL